MSVASLTCPRCQGHMDEGVTLDRIHRGMNTVTQWIEGAPEKSFWTGLKMKGKEQFPVKTFRCERCGYLESYANP
jgi:hypothetical protein